MRRYEIMIILEPSLEERTVQPSLDQFLKVVSGGGGKTVSCGVCHGPTLHGLGPIPPLAGRSPSYITRQLYEFQHGVRTGAWSPLMSYVVTNLTEDDLISISAYLASLKP